MKKIISAFVSLAMLLSMLTSISVFAANGVDAIKIEDLTATEAVSFKNMIEGKNGLFDENYFFMGKFILPSEYGEWDEYSDSIKFVVESPADGYIGWYSYFDDVLPGCTPVTNLSTYDEYYETKIEDGKYEVVIIDSQFKVSDLYNGAVDETIAKATTFGFALKNPDELTENAEVTLKLVSTKGEVETVIDEITHTFEAPVSFTSSELSDLASILADIDNGKTVSAETVKAALAKVNSEEAKAELIAATKTTEGEEAKIAEDALKALVMILANDVTVSTNNTSSKNVKVSLPYAALAIGSDVDVVVTDADDIDEVVVSDGETKLALDISLEKEGSKIQPLIPQIIEVELPADFAKGENKTVKIYHNDKNTVYENIAVVDGKVSVLVDSFSTFMIVGDEIVITEENMANEVQAVIERQKDADGEYSNVFKIGIKPINSEDAIVNFVDATFGIRITKNDMVSCDYKLNETVDGLIIDGIKEGSYTGSDKLVDINFLAQVPGGREGTASVTKGLGETLWIAELEVNGIGTATLVVGGIDVNNDSSEQNVIFTEVSQNRAKATPLKVSSQEIFTIEQKKHKIDIEIEFANALTEAKFADVDWLGMTVVFENRLTGDKQTAIVGNGNDEGVNYLKLSRSYKDGLEVSTAEGSVELIANNNYTFEVTGAGFRTVRGSILADKDKKITLWNNARHDKADGTVTSEEVVEGDGNPVYKNFLVGDIYMDGIVDIYDLSAVTSYYAPKKAVTDNKFATYDLNRDGYIDAADIAYVQVSYGN